MRLDWQRRAVILFAASLLVLSVVLVFFALREAEREKLVTERQVEAARQRLVEKIEERARSLIGEAEGRVLEAVKTLPPRIETARVAAVLEGSLADLSLVSEVFLVDARDQIVFLGARPLYLLTGEEPRTGHNPSSLQNDARWERAEAAEFRLNDPVRAAALYRDVATRTADPAMKAFAWNRQARCYAKSGQYAEALAAYAQQLEADLPDLASEGIPLDITALYQTGNIHLQLEQKAEAAGAFLGLYQGLVEAKWALSRDQYEYFRRLAEDRLERAADGIGTSIRADWDGRVQGLKEQEQERLAATGDLEQVQERIIPRLRLEAGRRDADPGRSLRIAEPTEDGILLASFKPLDTGTMLGMLFDPDSLASRLFSPGPARPGEADLMEGFSVAIIDGSGQVVAGQGLPLPDATEKSGEPQRAFTAAFAGSFPPWSIEVRQSGSSPAERQFRLRRTIYVLSLAAVIAALFFGGFLAIRSTAKELKLAKLKSDFTATVSHEFRTPLMSIRYMAELLQRGRVRDEPRKQQYYETITGESERLSRLVENLLDFSKIEAGVKEYRLEETDITALAADVAGRFRQQAAFKDFTLETEIAEDLPLIPADMDALGRAVLNLLDNAVKYSGANPRVTLRVWSGEDAINIQVEDHGIGIGKPEQKKIFEKFYRSVSALESDVKGSGIGLPLVEHVVRAHGGMVLLESELGKGTRVTIRLPIGAAELRKGDEHG